MLFERSADAMFLLDGEKYIDCNKAAMDMMKCSDKEELLNLHPSQTAPERQPDGRSSYEKSEDMIRTAFEKGTHKFEWVRRRTNGEEFPVEVTLTTIPWKGKQILHVILKDITEQKLADEALKESENKYRTIFENTGAATVILEEDNTISLANAEFEKLTGYSKVEIEGKKSWTEFVEREDLEKMIKLHRLRRENPDLTPRNYEFRLMDKKGRIKYILLTVDIIPGTKKSIASLLDISKRKQAEIAYQENLRFLQHLIDAIPISIFYKDTNGIYQGCNSAFEKFLGLSKGDIIGKSVYDISPVDLADSYKKTDQALFDKPGVQVYESSVMYADGTRHDVIFNKATYTDARGRLSGLVGVVFDITKRKRAEEALRESEEKYRNLVERANDGITIIQDGTVRYANTALAEIWGGSVEEIVGRPFTDFIDPDEIPNVVERYQRRMANESVTPTIYETILRRRDGTKIFADLNAGVITFQGTSADLVMIRDITERKVVEERLFSLLRFQNEMLDAASIWIDMFDAKGNTTFWNLAAERISGYSREEVLGHAKIWKWLYPDPEYRAKMIDDVTKILLRNERVENFETVIRLKDGGKRVISWHSSNFVDKDGKILGGIGIGVDITEKKEAENALKESKRRLADIVDFLPDATMVIDKDGKIISWNQAIVAMTGVKAEDILGKGDYEYAIPFYGQRRPILVDLVLKSQEEFETTYYNIERKDGILTGEAYMPNLRGRQVYLFGTAAALHDSKGNVVGAIESIRDITDYKRAEEALKAERDRAEQYLNIAEVILVALDAEARITLLNRKGYQVLGYEEGELMGRDWIKTCLRPQDHESVYEANRKIIAGEIEPFEYYESYILNKNGEERLIAWHTTIIKDGEGRIIGTLSSGEDITERRKTEEKNLQLAAIVESSNDAIFGALLDGTITTWNKGAERIYGYTEDEIIGQPVTLLVSPERLDEVPQILERLRQGEHIDHYESLCRRKDGEQFPVDLTISPIYDTKGRIIGTSSIVRDITERKRAEEALRASHQIIEGIINAIPVRVFWKDRDLVYLGCNAIFAQDAGFADPKDIVGKDDYQMGWRDQAELYRGDDRQVIESDRSKLLIEEPQTTPEGKTIVLLTSKIPLRSSEGEIIGVLGTYMDITERKRMEEDLRRSRDELEDEGQGED